MLFSRSVFWNARIFPLPPLLQRGRERGDIIGFPNWKKSWFFLKKVGKTAVSLYLMFLRLRANQLQNLLLQFEYFFPSKVARELGKWSGFFSFLFSLICRRCRCRGDPLGEISMWKIRIERRRNNELAHNNLSSKRRRGKWRKVVSPNDSFPF